MKLYPIALFIMLVSFGCKKHHGCNDRSNPQCENYDPCYGNLVTADFTIHQFNGWYVDPKAAKPEFCDTLLSNGASLNALMKEAESYTWKVGTDSRIFTGKTLELLFDAYRQDTNNINPQNKNYYKPITITLTIRNKAGGCIDTKDTLLTKTRNMVFAVESPWLGTFRGISNHDGKERVIQIYRYFVPNNFANPVRFVFKNLPNLLNKDSIIMFNVPNNILYSFKCTWWDFNRDDVVIDWTSSDVIKPRPYDGMNMGKIYIDPQSDGRDYLIFRYKYVTEGGSTKFYKFTGRREL